MAALFRMIFKRDWLEFKTAFFENEARLARLSDGVRAQEAEVARIKKLHKPRRTVVNSSNF
jgi:hypothetical protein